MALDLCADQEIVVELEGDSARFSAPRIDPKPHSA
jgi:hypothetical protein